MCKKGATFTKTRFAVNQDMDWLESLKDRVQPKLNQEWSEEDENRMKKVMHILSLDGRISNAELLSIYDWLKSLRPQNRWNPSDEQIKALEKTLKYFQMLNTFGETIDGLKELEKQLKKLREE